MIFRDPALQRRFDERGYVTIPALGPTVVDELRELYREQSLQDRYGMGNLSSFTESNLAIRRTLSALLVSKVASTLTPFFVSQAPYMAGFMVKEAHGGLLPPHQDWSHSEDPARPSLMCWIPLVDVDSDNGALGFIDGSHTYFQYCRPFPYREARTPVEQYWKELIPYLHVSPTRAGEAVVFDNSTIHGSLENVSATSRVAIAVSLRPAGEPFWWYFLKPGDRRDAVLRYRATDEFYLEYNDIEAKRLYRQGELPKGDFQELPYALPRTTWEEFELKLPARQLDHERARKAVESLARMKPRAPAV